MLKRIWDENKSNLYKPFSANSWAEVIDKTRQSINKLFNKLNQAYTGRTEGENYVMTLSAKGNPTKLLDEYGNPILKNPKGLTHTVRKSREPDLEIDKLHYKSPENLKEELRFVKDKYMSIDLTFTAEQEQNIKRRLNYYLDTIEKGEASAELQQLINAYEGDPVDLVEVLKRQAISEIVPDFYSRVEEKTKLREQLKEMQQKAGESGYLDMYTYQDKSKGFKDTQYSSQDLTQMEENKDKVI